MNILPQPANLKYQTGIFELTEDTVINLTPKCSIEILPACEKLQEVIRKILGSRLNLIRSNNELKNSISLGITKGKPQGYSLKTSENGIEINGNDTAGLFYGIQTLCQMLISEGRKLNFCIIEDKPDFAVRGFYHDFTRGKVPKLETLFTLVDKMAFYKLNQLQLYVEHTFAFARHCDLWAGTDPLTAEEIIKLDAYCQSKYIDLVPSLSTFGHMYMMLRSKRKEHLNELDVKASEIPYSFHDRMAHYTLDCSQQESADLVKELIDEYAPLFSSKYFNICCDETFDLGKGKNKEKAEKAGSSRLYIEFVKKIFKAVKARGKIPQFWGDIIMRSPEMLKELPEDVVALNWDYSPDICYDFSDSEGFAKAGVTFYNCPGTCGWSTNINRINRASQNILNFAREGKENNATGLLNTDWGDYGHVNFLSMSMHGMLLGAAASWNLENNCEISVFNSAFDLLEYGNEASGIAQLLTQADKVQKVAWFNISRWCDKSITPEDKCIFKAMDELTEESSICQIETAVFELEQIYSKLLDALPSISASDKFATSELLFSFKGSILMHKIVICIRSRGNSKFINADIADQIVKYENEFSQLWHQRNKPSEYYRIKDVLMQVVSRLNSTA